MARRSASTTQRSTPDGFSGVIPQSVRFVRRSAAQGADIVQEDRTESGGRSRWSFTEIRPRSFRWLGEGSPDGTSWWLIIEVWARCTSIEPALYPIPAEQPPA